jgi:hypothetical protein
MATDYILLIHGVDTRSPDFANQLMDLIVKEMPSSNRSLKQIPIYWGDLNNDREAKLLATYQDAPIWKDLWFQDLRAGDLFRFFGDAALYLSRYIGGAIADRIWGKVSPIFSDHDPESRLHFVTHSLGTTILFDLLFSTRWDGPPSLPGYASVQHLREKIYGIASDTQPALVGMPLGSVTTMGSPIGLFSLIDVDQTTQEILDATGVPIASHDITPRLQIMLKALNARLNGRQLPWLNYIHPGDPIGSPLQLLLPQLVDDPAGNYIKVQDMLVPVNFGDPLAIVGMLAKGLGISILDGLQAHGSYWTSDKVAEGIADIISQ